MYCTVLYCTVLYCTTVLQCCEARAAAVAGLERDNLALVHELSQERQHGREVEAEWALRLDTARQQHRDNLASLAALVAAQNKVPGYLSPAALSHHVRLVGSGGARCPP